MMKKITFDIDSIILQDEEKKVYVINDLNAVKLMEILEFCVNNENDLEICLEEKASPISKKLQEFLRQALEKQEE